MASLILNLEQIKDVYNLANKIYWPLTGFVRQKDFQSIVAKMRLSNNQIWPIPIVLDINPSLARKLKNKKQIKLLDQDQNLIAYLLNPQIYQYDKHFYAENVFATRSLEHPGVADVFAMNDYLIGGEIKLIKQNFNFFANYNLTPKQTKKIFKKNNWQSIVAFQTRNVPHRGHEFLQKEALKQVDGLMIQPVIGKKKIRDFKDEYIISCYQELIDKFYPQNKTLLTILPLQMRYAGPKEAVMHALIRRNFGCTHFIVGRDHAGVGGFYHPFAAHRIFDEFSEAEIGIKILKFPEVVYDKKNKKHAFVDQVAEKDRVYFSGSKLREYIVNKQAAPSYIIRAEILNILKNSKNNLIDLMYKKNKSTQGFILWFTGLSGSGKTTIADQVFELLSQKKIKVERLDGDVVRENLTKDLGFSKKDRLENIKRVSFVADLLAKNGVGVIASFISPYKKQRQKLKKKLHNFIEVYISTPLEICEKRDIKGLYKKARQGEIKNFTGISSPYEAPKQPDIEIKAVNKNPRPYAEQIIEYLEKNNYL